MKKSFDRVFKMSIISWIIFIILGLFLFMKAELTLRVISYIIGGVVLVSGIIPIIKTLSTGDKNYSSFGFVSGVFMIVAGLIILLNSGLIASIIPILIGIMMIINGISKLTFALTLKSNNIGSWISTLILAIIITMCGIVFIVNPFGGAVLITKIIGVVIIVYSVVDMIDFLIINKNIKESDFDTNIKEVTGIKIIDEKE